MENQIRQDKDVGRNPILDAGGNRSTQEKTCEVGNASATKLTYKQRGDPGDRTRSTVVRGECYDHYTTPTSHWYIEVK